MTFKHATLRSYLQDPRRLAVWALLAVAAAAPAQTYLGTGQNNYVTYGGSSATFFNGIYINDFLGATSVYAAGYTGTRAIAANIGGGYAWNGHIDTTKLQTYIPGSADSLARNSASYTDHETACTFAIGGYGTSFDPKIETGIAYGATLWSGNNATQLFSNGSFNTSLASEFTPYYNAFIGGVRNQTADVSNSSWGYTSSDAATMQKISAGYYADQVAIDGVVANSHRTIVFSAGNSGQQTTNQHLVGGIAGGNNTFVVGSTGPNNPGGPSFNSRSSFSSWGKNSFYNPVTNTFVDNARIRVDIVAPGEQTDLAAYNNGIGNSYFLSGSGTSFAAPAVAGGVALMADVAKDRFANNLNALDNRVMIATLMNSADKLAGWTNNASIGGDGVYRTTQALDENIGAGQMNLKAAFNQFTGGTTDVAGLGGGTVKTLGWDFGEVNKGGKNDYLIDTALLGGSTFTATLRWNVGAGYNLDGNNVIQSATYGAFADLSLDLFRVDGATSTLVAESNTQYMNTEHINYTLDSSAKYLVRVNYLGNLYDPSGNHSQEDFGLAWRATPVPEPASFLPLGLGALVLLRRRRKA